MNLGEGPDFPLLQDFFLASAGRRSAAFVEGEVFGAEVVFFPSAHPLRAQIIGRCELAVPDPALPAADPLEAYVRALGREPWLSDVPLALSEGRLALAEDGSVWWRGAARSLPVLGSEVPKVAFGLSLRRGGDDLGRASGGMLQAETPPGRIGLHGRAPVADSGRGAVALDDRGRGRPAGSSADRGSKCRRG